MSGNGTAWVIRWLECALVVAGSGCLLWSGSVSLRAIVYQSGQNAPSARSAAGEVVRQASIGRLEIPRLGVSVVVAEGDDDETLKMAVGHLPDTPLPWQQGNSALAGHRDSFFRPLRRIQVGDDIRLATPHGIFHYRVTRHTVVDPDELWVLDSAPFVDLTLITCYPFDFVGPAPRRFIVHAARVAPDGAMRASPNRGGTYE